MNAKNELVDFLDPELEIRCASIRFEPYYSQDTHVHIVLKDNHSPEDYLSFLDKLDFEYEEGFGIQLLYGTVWLEGGSWLDRGEYDGSEWWEHRVCPEIPSECI